MACHMTLCPSCRSIQRAWSLCPICRTYVVPRDAAGYSKASFRSTTKPDEAAPGSLSVMTCFSPSKA
jgi:hypothetical protein